MKQRDRAQHRDAMLGEHAQEAAFLWSLRTQLANSPGIDFQRLAALDERLDAHIDALHTGEERAWQLCRARLTQREPGEAFVVMTRAVQREDEAGMRGLLALTEAVPALEPGSIDALGWVSAAAGRRAIRAWSRSCVPEQRRLALLAGVQHRLDPGVPLAPLIRSGTAELRAAALSLIGALGEGSLAEACADSLRHDEDPGCRLQAARTLILLGCAVNEEDFCRLVMSLAEAQQREALRLALATLTLGRARELHAQFAARARVEPLALAWLGDPRTMEALIERMSDQSEARACGEAFQLVTGLDVRTLSLDPGQNDSEADGHGAWNLDAERYLPWPDAPAIQDWWHAARAHFDDDVRYLAGAPREAERCRQLLRRGDQRLRALAAWQLAVFEPRSGLFPVCAPARAQKRRLCG